mmetsp:Transcript_3735/g.9015  ORF Transcript_3735/g.9015 Transcript_3735/m.9015 type:complete len:207 (+) Transcript_3735:5449-6069(+)|eukprot:3649478-Rhodomonas_salina.5
MLRERLRHSSRAHCEQVRVLVSNRGPWDLSLRWCAIQLVRRAESSHHAQPPSYFGRDWVQIEVRAHLFLVWIVSIPRRVSQSGFIGIGWVSNSEIHVPLQIQPIELDVPQYDVVDVSGRHDDASRLREGNAVVHPHRLLGWERNAISTVLVVLATVEEKQGLPSATPCRAESAVVGMAFVSHHADAGPELAVRLAVSTSADFTTRT